MSLTDLRNVLIDQLRDLYNAEKQLTKALPKMAKGAGSDELRIAFEQHLQVTEGHVERLDDAFAELGMQPKPKKCHAMEGLIEEGKEVLDEADDGEPPAVDAALIAAAQRVEHYEIAAYGTARAFAEVLGLRTVADLLQQTLDEEREADEALTGIAKTVNAQAAQPQSAAGGPKDDESDRESDEDDAAQAARPARDRELVSAGRANGARRPNAQSSGSARSGLAGRPAQTGPNRPGAKSNGRSQSSKRTPDARSAGRK